MLLFVVSLIVATAFALDSPYREITESASISRVHWCNGLSATSSNGSAIDGNVPPAVCGPFEAENSVVTMLFVPFQTRTFPAVWSIAAFVRTCSTDVGDDDAAPPRVAAPKYTWHELVSHVEAYEYRFWASPYERAATAWARNESAGQLADTSFGTTPRRYNSVSSSLTTRLPSPVWWNSSSPR